jgi:hypothetical protein
MNPFLIIFSVDWMVIWPSLFFLNVGSRKKGLIGLGKQKETKYLDN